MKLKPNIVYRVIKGSNDGSFHKGEKIILKDDGCIWIGEDVVEPAGIAKAIIGMKVKEINSVKNEFSNAKNLLDLSSEMWDLLQTIRDTVDCTCPECDSKSIVPAIDSLIDKIDAVLGNKI